MSQTTVRFSGAFRWPNGVAVGLFGVVGVALSLAVSQKTEQPNNVVEARPNIASQRQDRSLALPYLTSTHSGVFSLRPSKIFGRPDAKRHFKAVDQNEALRAICKELGVESDVLELLASVEQVCGRVTLQTIELPSTPPAHPCGLELKNHTRLAFEIATIRMKHDFDWKKSISAILRGATSVEYSGKMFYRFKKGAAAEGSLSEFKDLVGIVFLGRDIAGGDCEEKSRCCFFPDTRSIVLDTEVNLKNWIDGKTDRIESHDAKSDWERLEPGFATLSLDNNNQSWVKDRQTTKTHNSNFLLALIRNATNLTVGVDYADGKGICEISINCGSDVQAETVLEAGRSLLAHVDQELKESPGDKSHFEMFGEALPDPTELRSQFRLTRSKAAVIGRTVARYDFTDWLKFLNIGEMCAWPF